jgi:hypothetical protein
LPADVRANLLVVPEQLSPLRALGDLNTGLESAVRLRLDPKVVEQLPEPVRRLWRGLDGLQEIGATLAGPSGKMPNAATLTRRLTDVQAATGDKRLTGALRDALIARAERGGHTPLARVLRDFEVVDIPAPRALPPEDAVPLPIPEPPPGVRPGQVESVWEGLPELKEPATKASRQLAQRLTAEVKWQSEFHSSLAHAHAHLALHLHRQTKPDERRDEEKRRAVEAVERALSRGLTPAERIIAADMLRRGRSPEVVTADLRRCSGK